jgi:nicotinamidase-related amidase
MPIDYTTPIPEQSVLLTIDVQQDFTAPGAVAEIAGTNDRLPVMRRMLDAYRRQHLPIIHMLRLYLADGSNADLCRRAAIENGNAVVLPGTAGAELAEPLQPAASDTHVDATLL